MGRRPSPDPENARLREKIKARDELVDLARLEKVLQEIDTFLDRRDHNTPSYALKRSEIQLALQHDLNKIRELRK